jgi:hypothetical protein
MQIQDCTSTEVGRGETQRMVLECDKFYYILRADHRPTAHTSHVTAMLILKPPIAAIIGHIDISTTYSDPVRYIFLSHGLEKKLEGHVRSHQHRPQQCAL